VRLDRPFEALPRPLVDRVDELAVARQVVERVERLVLDPLGGVLQEVEDRQRRM
jgi:hypothetical protein